MNEVQAIAAIVWPLAYALLWWGSIREQRRLRDDATWYRRTTEDAYRLIEAQQVMIRETRGDNVAAFKVVAAAASRLVESGASADELIGWLRASQVMSQNHQDTTQRVCAQHGARR